ncbi:MAG: zinc ribbon domain-containing protein [Candidatus Izimaplasma sp.]|nr:zinc ribbon domain-containing protein [Candidatus Izimaplasma bacterium]
MKSTTKFTFFVVLVSLFIAVGGMSLIFVDMNIGWFPLIGIAPFIFVFIMVAIMLTNGAIEQKTDRTLACPHCHKDNYLDHDFCAYCGKKLRPQIECEFCGAMNDYEQERCEICDATLHKS